MPNKHLRYLLEITIFLKKVTFNSFKNYVNVSQRTWYRWVNSLNSLLIDQNLLPIKINSELSQKQLLDYKNFLLSINENYYLELNNSEVALIWVFDYYKNGFFKIMAAKKNYGLSASDIHKIKTIINLNLEKKISLNQSKKLSNYDFCVFLYNWLLKYFQTKNIFEILINHNLSAHLPIKIRSLIFKNISQSFYDLLVKKIIHLQKNETAIRDFFYFSLLIFSWSFFNQKNLLEPDIFSWILPDNIFQIIRVFLKLPNEITNELIKTKIHNVFSKINLKILPDLNFLEMLKYHLKNFNTVEKLDEINSNYFLKLSTAYKTLSEIINLEFHDFITNDNNESYYLLVYFLSHIRNQITSYPWKILTICWGGLGMSHILKTTIYKTLNNSNIVACSLIELQTNLENNDYDLIFTTVDLEQFENKNKVVKINHSDILSSEIFNEQVWLKLYSLFIQNHNSK